MQTRSQRYASLVFDKVRRYEEKEEKAKKYGSIAYRLPVLVRKAGLAQALAFVDARRGEEGKELLSHLAEVVGKEDRESLLEFSRKAPLTDYMHLTYEVMAALDWFKRFSESVLGIEAGNNGEEGESG